MGCWNGELEMLGQALKYRRGKSPCFSFPLDLSCEPRACISGTEKNRLWKEHEQYRLPIPTDT